MENTNFWNSFQKQAGVADKIMGFAIKNPEITLGALGGVIGAASVGTDHALGNIDDKIKEMAKGKGIDVKSKEYKDFRKKWMRITYGAGIGINTLAGAFMGHQLRKATRGYARSSGGEHARGDSVGSTGMDFHSALEFLGLSGNETTKAQVKRKYHQAAMKHHPDVGGATEVMQKVTAAWEELKHSSWFQKLAFINLGSALEKHAGAFKEMMIGKEDKRRKNDQMSDSLNVTGSQVDIGMAPY